MPAKSRRWGASLDLHAGLDQAVVRAVHVVGAEAEVPEVDLRVVGAAQLELQPEAGSVMSAKPSKRRFDDHAERARQAVDLFIEVGHGQGDVVDSGCDHLDPFAS